MNSLLKRQIRKYLPQDLANSKDLEAFIDAVNRSYKNYDDQFFIIQRSMEISSEELSIANKQLREEAERQKEIIEKLKSVINTLKFYELPENKKIDVLELDGTKLVDFIEKQTKDIIKMNKQREELLDNLAHQNQELNDYAHMVSHDLKSPLRSIDALTAWLKEDYHSKLDRNGSKTLDLIRNNVSKMDTLISGILDYSTIDKSKTEFYNIDLNILLEDILSVIHIPKHISVKVVNKLPTIKGDKNRLQQLFQNIIDNAIKYNDKENGEVEVGVIDKNEYWEFYIKDNGKGIDEVYFEKIFKTFQKLENNPESTGIGLSIVKKIIEIYEGKIWVESKLGKETTFYFTIKKNRDGKA